MESLLIKLLDTLKIYGPGAIIGVVFIYFYIKERKENARLTEKLNELSLESMKADSEHAKAYEALSKTFTAIDTMLQCILKFLGNSASNKEKTR